VRGDRVRIVDSLSFGALSALLVRRDMDRDHSRRIAPDEARAWVEKLAKDLRAATRYALDRRPAHAAAAPPFFDGADGMLRTDPFTIELGQSVRIAAGRTQTLTVTDRFAMRAMERTVIAAEAVPPAVLLAAGPRAAPRSLERTAMWILGRDAPDPRVFAVRFQTPAPPRQPFSWKWPALGAAALAVASVAVALAIRARRRRP
jgi:hypothetical protein